MTILHVCDGWQPLNGAANIARLIAGEQASQGHAVRLCRWVSPRALRRADEVWIHCGWKPCLWWAAFWARCAVWVPEACYDPIRLSYHGWKKALAGLVERWALRRCARVVATCRAEAGWVRAYEPRVRKIDVTDIRRFFPLERTRPVETLHHPLRVLYLGRLHPLKGVAFLERAVASCGGDAELKVVSTAQGEEKERIWRWADVLCLPTLSDNLGLVVAEALARGKRVITTDGAPAWEDDAARCDGSLVYLEGYRDGSDEERIRLLSVALRALG